MKAFGIVLVALLVVAGGSRLPAPIAAPVKAPAAPATATATATTGPRPLEGSVSSRPTVEQLIGQKLVIRMEGVTPSADLLGRIRRGEVGGVILFGSNVTTRAALVALTAGLRAAAVAGGQPRLLIAVDQEGGPIKRIPWAPPTLSAPQMGDDGRASVARAQGASAGAALRDLGIDVDFAPVADVPSSTASFMYRGGRTFSFSAASTAVLADAFASGLESNGVLPTMKHFPGIGFARRNTDASVVTVTASSAVLAPGLEPYRTAIAHHIPLIMLSNATYAAYDPRNAAGWSRAIGVSLLRDQLGFTGVTITDSLDGTAFARGLSTRLLAVRAAKAGTDMILTTGSEASTRAVFATLVREAKEGAIPAVSLRASYDRILALKSGL
ncbi:MAG TPA: glycoside hydrolase family 3 N-terminal domain-containing protein [Candidatus Limnocylindrales bacterium]